MVLAKRQGEALRRSTNSASITFSPRAGSLGAEKRVARYGAIRSNMSATPPNAIRTTARRSTIAHAGDSSISSSGRMTILHRSHQPRAGFHYLVNKTLTPRSPFAEGVSASQFPTLFRLCRRPTGFLGTRAGLLLIASSSPGKASQGDALICHASLPICFVRLVGNQNQSTARELEGGQGVGEALFAELPCVRARWNEARIYQHRA
jgi:hypothetical protein